MPDRKSFLLRLDPQAAFKKCAKIVGDVMKATRGQADPARVKELVIAACS